ncbi:hypothetical protein RB195_010680 [Necator americanus]|uniref:Uncharacterized protein n=1 Tax=Necator americanus TaxID=51031 RepID=A0ABR1CYZ9_NECAM
MFLLFFGQTISIDGTLCTTCAAQKAKQAGDSEKNCLEKAVVAATKRMQDASTPNNMSEPPATSAADTRNATTSTSFLEEVDRAGQHTQISSRISDSLSLAQIVACFDNLEDYRLRGDSPDLRPELRRFFARIKYERDINALEAAARHFLESCDRVFLDNAKELFRKEIQNIHDCKDALEKLISSERLQWSLERENMELQLDRYRRQVEQFPSIHKENVVIKSELNAMKTQIEQYKLKLRQKSEEVERLEIERDRLTVLAKEFQKLDQESQNEVKEANRVIDELERKDKDASAELERERRKIILLQDDIDAYTLLINNLETANSGWMQKVQQLTESCKRLEKNEKYNQKTIQMVCQCFWEREEYVKRLRTRSSERRRLIERFVEEVSAIIAKFGGNSDPVNEMHVTITSWASADERDDNDHDSRKRNLCMELAQLSLEQQSRLAQQQALLKCKQQPQ